MVNIMLLVFGIQYILLLLPQVTGSQLVPCYSKFDMNTGTCNELIGNVTQGHCCFNSNYGFRKESGKCMSCRQASWSAWSSWGPCSVSCLKGVKQRRRRCDGIGECRDPEKLGILQTTICEDIDCCPEQGGWGEWGPWKPCSVSCADGVSSRERLCANPPPKCGGGCDGPGQDLKPCSTGDICPTHGSWSEWGPWNPCSGTCKKEGDNPPSQERRRTCTNPAPSSEPAGRSCQGVDTDTQPCDFLRMCPIDGGWGAWGPLSECSVTCGVGQRFAERNCNNPALKYGGKFCVGDSRTSEICNTQTHCPVDGEWQEWEQWGTCTKGTYPRPISCTKKTGKQSRERSCLFKDFDGHSCAGSPVEHRLCYDISSTSERRCEKPARWNEWTEWSFCHPPCGPGSKQKRERLCVPDLPESENNIYYSGKPRFRCPGLSAENRTQSEDCPNVPAC
ncbi:properdin isoform X2 [Clupea harengus]|uniref:Properdin isoform X2 n=1 Tax=Clupea harengus TaxID=7950 RepID=A0A6P3VLR8_CLUHA|nr:properdin isoform X2 [Clupea harengus]